ncbi:MAG TPA: cytochrome c, partial [Oxalicibacterium sp.]|nr:cytochrome c [Oxalicibacterium sp.]
MKRVLLRLAALLLILVALFAAWLIWANRNSDLAQPSVAPGDPAARIAQGAYLVRVGNCAGCHTAR